MRVSPLLLLAYLFPTTAFAEVELKNDSFVSGGNATLESGFAMGEIGAARFTAPDAGRTLLKVQFLFGGATTNRTITLKVFDDSAGTPDPGGVLYSNDFQVTGSDSAMQEIAVTDMQVVLPQTFRVGIEFGQGCPAAPNPCGNPTMMRDQDGATANKNFIFTSDGMWVSSTAFFNGDWIIRAIVSDTGSGLPGGDGGMTTGGTCTGNPDCPAGQFCDTAAGACTFECRVDEDCGGGVCNSLGQCVGGSDGGGCCQADGGGGETGPLIFGASILGLLVVRRRRCG